MLGLNLFERENNKPFQGNMRHVFDEAKLFISNTRCCLRRRARTSRALDTRAWSSNANEWSK